MPITAEKFADEMESLAGSINQGFEPLLQSFVEPIRQGVQLNFDNEQTSDESPWPKRKDPTLTHKLLHLTGALEAAATGSGANHVETIHDNTLTYGVSGIVYAATHQYGDAGRNIPQREYLGISDVTLDNLTEMATDFTLNRIIGSN